MTPSEWSRLQQIAGEVLDLPVAERDACLDRACGADTDLRRRVLALVEASGEAEEFFDQAFGGLASEMLAEDPAEQQATYTAPSIGVGQRIGRYVIEGVLGSGGMGVAFAARDTELDRTVALKFVRLRALESSAFVDDESAESQVREAKAASALNHPYIVTVHEVLRSEFGVAIVMEMVNGEVLRTLCGQAQPMERVLRIGEQMAEALAAAGECWHCSQRHQTRERGVAAGRLYQDSGFRVGAKNGRRVGGAILSYWRVRAYICRLSRRAGRN